MKVGGTGGASALGGAGRSVRPSSGGFAPSSTSETRESAPASAMGGINSVGSLDALLALQETPGPLEKRRRAVKRAGGLLDLLDEVKLSLLDDGGDPRAALGRLSSALREARDGTEDAGLESLLDQIDTRAAVELAKDEMARREAGAAA